MIDRKGLCVRARTTTLIEALEEVAEQLPASEPDAEPMNLNPAVERLTIDIPASLHTRIKRACVANQQNMADAIRTLLEKHWPAERAA